LPAGAGKQKRKAKNGLLQYSLDGTDGKENAGQRNEAPLRENSVAKYAKGWPIPRDYPLHKQSVCFIRGLHELRGFYLPQKNARDPKTLIPGVFRTPISQYYFVTPQY